MNQLNRLKFLIVVFCIPFLTTNMYSCTCVEPAYNFVDNLEKYPFVGIVEVIGRDTTNENKRGYTYTIVKVLRQFTKEYYGQEFKIVEAKGFECITRLRDTSIGARSIVKGHFSPKFDWDYNYENLMSEQEDEKVMLLGLCDKSQLYIEPETNKVVGPLTFNKLMRKIKRDIFLNKISFGLIKTKGFKSGYFHVMPSRTSLRNAISIISDLIEKEFISQNKINNN